jgi:hypothetical protein
LRIAFIRKMVTGESLPRRTIIQSDKAALTGFKCRACTGRI